MFGHIGLHVLHASHKNLFFKEKFLNWVLWFLSSLNRVSVTFPQNLYELWFLKTVIVVMHIYFYISQKWTTSLLKFLL